MEPFPLQTYKTMPHNVNGSHKSDDRSLIKFYMHACPSFRQQYMYLFYFFLHFRLQEQREVSGMNQSDQDLLTERGSNSVEHCPGSNNSAGRRHTAAHCAASGESAPTRSAEAAPRAQVRATTCSNGHLQLKEATSAVKEDTICALSRSGNAAARLLGSFASGQVLSNINVVFRPVATETKQFWLDH